MPFTSYSIGLWRLNNAFLKKPVILEKHRIELYKMKRSELRLYLELTKIVIVKLFDILNVSILTIRILRKISIYLTNLEELIKKIYHPKYTICHIFPFSIISIRLRKIGRTKKRIPVVINIRNEASWCPANEMSF